jgi:hypothetical protein
MGVVPLDAVWVDANFKEVQLHDMRVGQPVRLRADVYGGKVAYGADRARPERTACTSVTHRALCYSQCRHSDTSGPLVSEQVRQIPIPSQASLANDPQEDARIAQIIKDNLALPKDASKIAANLSH